MKYAVDYEHAVSFASTRCVVSLTVLPDHASTNTSLVPVLRQMTSNLTSQATTLTLGAIPKDLLINLNPLSYIILVSIYAHIIYPTIDRLGIRYTPIRRISIGFFLSALVMTVAAVIQHFIYSSNQCGKHANECVRTSHKSHLSVWVQLAIYVSIANSEILAGVTGIEHAYSQATKNMRSMIMALFIFTGTGGSAIVQMLVPLSGYLYLVWNYVVVGSLSLIASSGVLCFNRETSEEKSEEVCPEVSRRVTEEAQKLVSLRWLRSRSTCKCSLR
jgi:POT family proton-dependent oligopeptide transporter